MCLPGSLPGSLPVPAQEMSQEQAAALESTVNDYKAQLATAATKHEAEVAEVMEVAEATEADAKKAQAEMGSRLADLEVMLDDSQGEVARLQGEIKQHEMEKAVKDAQGGTLVECMFTDPGSLGIIFEGTSGHDIHVNGISSGSPASHLAHLRHGMLLKKVQDVDVTELDYDDALGHVINSTRPLKMHFYDPPEVAVTFEEAPDDFGLHLAGTSARDIYIEKIDDDSEAGDFAGLRPGLLLKQIDGKAVEEMASYAEILALVNDGQRPKKMVFRVHQARQAKSKLKMAVKLGAFAYGV